MRGRTTPTGYPALAGRTASGRHGAVPVGVAALLAATALLPLAQPLVQPRIAGLARTAGVAVGVAVVVGAAYRVARLTREGGLRAVAGRGGRLLLHLWPVALLTAIYPVASQRMAAHRVGGVELTTFLLAVALSVPWLSQGACMPLYRVIGEVVSATADTGDPATTTGAVGRAAARVGRAAARAELRRRFCAAWPTTFVQTMPVLLIGVAPLHFVLRWSPDAIGCYLLLLCLDVLFAQALVVANVGRSRVGWALAWTGYALPVLVAPTHWYLPPLLGLLTQLVVLRRQLATRPVWLPWRGVRGDVVRGLLLGSVMWADKVFYFFRSTGEFPVVTVFLALLPGILAYTYYFICLAPEFDASVARLRTAMESEPLGVLGDRSRAVSAMVAATVRRVALLGAAATCATSWLLAAADPALAWLASGASLAAWLFTMVTVVCYKLDYIGERLPGQVLGGAHVVACAAAFLLLPTGAAAYLAVAAVEVALLGAVIVACRRAWRTPEYTFFWQHALAW